MMVGEINPPRVYPYNVASLDHAVKGKMREKENSEKSLTFAAPPGKPRWAAKNEV